MAGEIAFAGPTAIKNARFAAGVFVLAAGLSGCAGLFPQTAELRAGRPTGIPEEVELKQVPFFPQTEYQCGPAALATVLANAQVKITPEALVPEVYLPERKGSLQVEMLAATRRHGMVSYQLAPRFEDLLREIAAGNPVIVLQNFAFGPFGGFLAGAGLIGSGTTSGSITISRTPSLFGATCWLLSL